ncbi:MAG: YraN family protein [Clostridia bacterium]|nr:YraN family protein [Clostridia bacterium]
MQSFHKTLGAEGEKIAAEYLKQHGLVVAARNVVTSHAELDLIAIDGDNVCFVEVKTMTEQSRAQFGDPAEKVTQEKRRRITLSAAEFLARNAARFSDMTPRFDVVEVTFTSRRVFVHHIKNAFEAQSGFHKKKLF